MNNLGKTIVAVIAAIIVGIGGYFLISFFISTSSPQNGDLAPGSKNGATAEEIKNLTSEAIFDFWMNTATGEVYYVNTDGRISKITAEGSDQFLTSQNIPSLNKITPSDDGSSVLIGFGYPQTPAFSVFNTSKRSFQALPAGTTAADWKPQSNTVVVYLQNTGLTSRLSTLDLATGKSTELLKLNQRDLQLDWAFPESVYIYEKPSDQVLNTIWMYDIKSRTIRKIGEEKDLSIMWLPEKSSGLKWGNGKLSLVNKLNQQISTSDLKTIPSKCFSGRSLIHCSAANNQNNVSVNKLSSRIMKKDVTENESIYVAISFNLGEDAKINFSKVFDSAAAGVRFRAERIVNQTDRLLLLNQDDHKLYSLPL